MAAWRPDVGGELHRVGGRVGAIVETPAMFPTMSGRRNLQLLGRLHGVGPGRVTEVLEWVGLAEQADDSVKRYSLGMRQRLGLAAAPPKDPEVLLLVRQGHARHLQPPPALWAHHDIGRIPVVAAPAMSEVLAPSASSSPGLAVDILRRREGNPSRDKGCPVRHRGFAPMPAPAAVSRVWSCQEDPGAGGLGAWRGGQR